MFYKLVQRHNWTSNDEFMAQVNNDPEYEPVEFSHATGGPIIEVFMQKRDHGYHKPPLQDSPNSDTIGMRVYFKDGSPRSDIRPGSPGVIVGFNIDRPDCFLVRFDGNRPTNPGEIWQVTRVRFDEITRQSP